MALIREEDRVEVTKRFEVLKDDVSIVLFTSEENCQLCDATSELLEEVASLSEKIGFEKYDLLENASKASQYGIDKAPGFVILDSNGNSRGIRNYGIPSGYEFAALLEDIIMFSTGDSGLKAATKEALGRLKEKVHMQVFVTPTCPYCPGAARMAHQMAFESENVIGDMIEATEFPELSQKYRVMGVPRTVINEDHFIEGMVPETRVLAELQKAVA